MNRNVFTELREMKHTLNLLTELKRRTITLTNRHLSLNKQALSSIISVNRKRELKPLVIHLGNDLNKTTGMKPKASESVDFDFYPYTL